MLGYSERVRKGVAREVVQDLRRALADEGILALAPGVVVPQHAPEAFASSKTMLQGRDAGVVEENADPGDDVEDEGRRREVAAAVEAEVVPW